MKIYRWLIYLLLCMVSSATHSLQRDRVEQYRVVPTAEPERVCCLVKAKRSLKMHHRLFCNKTCRHVLDALESADLVKLAYHLTPDNVNELFVPTHGLDRKPITLGEWVIQCHDNTDHSNNDRILMLLDKLFCCGYHHALTPLFESCNESLILAIFQHNPKMILLARYPHHANFLTYLYNFWFDSCDTWYRALSHNQETQAETAKNRVLFVQRFVTQILKELEASHCPKFKDKCQALATIMDIMVPEHIIYLQDLDTFKWLFKHFPQFFIERFYEFKKSFTFPRYLSEMLQAKLIAPKFAAAVAELFHVYSEHHLPNKTRIQDDLEILLVQVSTCPSRRDLTIRSEGMLTALEERPLSDTSRAEEGRSEYAHLSTNHKGRINQWRLECESPATGTLIEAEPLDVLPCHVDEDEAIDFSVVD